MISIVEPLCHGVEHASVNAGMVQVVRAAFPSEPLAFHAEPAHLAEVRATLEGFDLGSIDWQPAELAPRAAGLAERWRTDVALMKRIVTQTARAKGQQNHVLSLQSIPTVLLAAAGLRAVGIARQPIRAVLHGYLNEAFGWRSRNPLVRMWDMRSALQVAASRVHLIALEPGIAEAVAGVMPSVAARIATVRLPLPSVPATTELPGTAPDQPIRFGFLGLATTSKGFDVFVAAARALKPRHGARIEFHAFGRFPPNSGWDMEMLQGCLTTLPSSASMPRHRFDAQVARLHYVCLPFRADHYTLSASGVLLDALAHDKPVIAGSTPAVRDLFVGASPGVLMDDPGQLEVAVDEVVRTFSGERYRQQVEQMRGARARRSLERLAEDYRAIDQENGTGQRA